MNTAQLESIGSKQNNNLDSAAVSVPPKVNQSQVARRSNWWIWLIIVFVVAGVGSLVYHLLGAAKSSAADSSKSRAVHDLPVVVAKVRHGNLEQYLVGLGNVTPLNTVTVKSRVDGAITKIWFKEGETVKKDQPLIDIDSRPYEAALQQAQGQLAKDNAAVESADWNVQQDTVALKDHAIAQQQLHTDTATRDQARGAVQIDNAAITNAKLNIAYSHITAPIDGTVGLRLVDEGNIIHASDTAGLVVITQLQPITVVFTVPEDNVEQVQRRIASGLPLAVDAYDRDLTRKLASGNVLAIDNQIDPSTGTVKIKALFDNKDNALYPSQFVNAQMLVNTISNAVLVPTAAVQQSPTSTFAYVVVSAATTSTDQSATAGGDIPPSRHLSAGADSKLATTSPEASRETRTVTMRQIVTGAAQAAVGPDTEDITVILSGLEPGEIVVTDGVDKLLEGTKVIPTFGTSAKAHAATRESATRPATTQPARARRSNRSE